MARKVKAPRITAAFSLGGETAEADPLLDEAFVDFAGFTVAEARLNPKRFLIGRTGSGKSAVLRHLEDVHPKHVLRINPENLALPYLTDLNVVRELTDLGVHLDSLFKALWKHVLLVEIIRHRYQVTSAEKKATVFETLKDFVRRDPSKQAALDYLDEFGGSFWCPTDERVREITERFELEVSAAGHLSGGLPGIGEAGGGAEAKRTVSKETRSEQAERYQRIVNKTQLSRLNEVMEILDEHVLASEVDFLYVVIDDLDRDWVDERIANDLIRCLFQTVLDFQRVKNLKIVIALRTNIFDFISFGARSGGQEEKFRALVQRIRWTERELRQMADERARIAAEKAGLTQITGVASLLPSRNQARGDPFDYILDRTLMRPRDVIAFLNECLDMAVGRSRLTWDDIRTAETNYSVNRLLALRDEWKPTFPGIGDCFQVFRGADPTLSEEALIQYLEAVALLVAEENFEGVVWLTELTDPYWSGGAPPTDWTATWQPLVQLLYNVGFLGVINGAGKTHFSNEAPGYADSSTNLIGGVRFAVHSTFHPALGIRRQKSRTS